MSFFAAYYHAPAFWGYRNSEGILTALSLGDFGHLRLVSLRLAMFKGQRPASRCRLRSRMQRPEEIPRSFSGPFEVPLTIALTKESRAVILGTLQASVFPTPKT